MMAVAAPVRVAVAVVGTFIVGIAAGVALKELGVDAAEFEKMLAKALPKAAAAAAAVAGEKAE